MLVTALPHSGNEFGNASCEIVDGDIAVDLHIVVVAEVAEEVKRAQSRTMPSMSTFAISMARIREKSSNMQQFLANKRRFLC
jgi:hypothetical protein